MTLMTLAVLVVAVLHRSVWARNNVNSISFNSSASPMQSGVSYWHGGMSGSNAGDAGYSLYTNMFNLFQEEFPLHVQMGLAATWFTLDRQQGQELKTCACPKWGKQVGCCNQVQSWCTGLAWSIEGGGGYWRDTFPKKHATWRLGASSACYHSYARTLDWNPTVGPCGLMNVIQLSNRMLLPPDGASFSSAEGLVGYGWLDTPYGKTSTVDARNFWTLVFDTATFSGPILYILPEFYALREPGQNIPSIPDLGTCSALQMGENAAEVQMVPTFRADTGEWRLPKMRLPTSDGRTVLSMGQRAYHRADVGTVLESALASGRLNTSLLMTNGESIQPSCAGGSCISDAVFTVNADAQKVTGSCDRATQAHFVVSRACKTVDISRLCLPVCLCVYSFTNVAPWIR